MPSYPPLGRPDPTYVHVHCLSIAAVSVQVRRHHDELVVRDEVPDAALVLGRLVAVYGVQIEFEGCGEGREEEEGLQEAE
jgi:hypothetical protein